MSGKILRRGHAAKAQPNLSHSMSRGHAVSRLWETSTSCCGGQGKELQGATEGILCIKQAWPSTIRTIKGDHKRFEMTYFSTYKARLLPSSHMLNTTSHSIVCQLQPPCDVNS